MITVRSFSARDLAVLLDPPDMDRAVLALDGPMFDGSGSEYLLYDRVNGTSVPSRHPDDGMTISVVGNLPFATDGASVVPGARVAVQGYPTLVVNGRNVASPSVDTSAEWRAGMAIMRDGTLAFAVGQMSMWQFAEEFARAGADEAMYTDGGSSASLWTQAGRYGHPAPRDVPSWLVVRGSFVPPALLVAAALAGGGYYAWRKYGRRG